jgi:hypothetical protein
MAYSERVVMQPLTYSRHSKNRMRWMGLTPGAVEQVLATPESTDQDADGRPRYTGTVRGQRVRVVVALDDPNFVVTVHERS